MIPPLDDATGNLPAGVHDATWAEVMQRYGTTGHRRTLLAGLRAAGMSLRAGGCAVLYLDGSFITEKKAPGDFDGCWDAHGVDLNLVDPVLIDVVDLRHGRPKQKAKYGGELFPTMGFFQFFQRDKFTTDPKGIIALDLGSI